MTLSVTGIPNMLYGLYRIRTVNFDAFGTKSANSMVDALAKQGVDGVFPLSVDGFYCVIFCGGIKLLYFSLLFFLLGLVYWFSF